MLFAKSFGICLRNMFLALFALVLGLFCLVPIWVIFSCNFPLFPSDASLIERFHAKRTFFDKAVKMCEEDKHVFSVVLIEKHWLPLELRNLRGLEYQAVLNEIGGCGLMQVSTKNGNVFFVIQRRFNGDVKGLAHLFKAPKCVETSLNDQVPFGFRSYHQEPKITESDVAFRKIVDGWYIWREIEF